MLAPGLASSGKSWRLVDQPPTVYSVGMAKKLWTYRDVTDFLERNGFSFYEDLEHCQSWVKYQDNGEPETFVEIRFTQGFYSPKAMQKMIRQSGIGENEWNKWASF
jgi:hypothetical protein